MCPSHQLAEKQSRLVHEVGCFPAGCSSTARKARLEAYQHGAHVSTFPGNLCWGLPGGGGGGGGGTAVHHGRRPGRSAQAGQWARAPRCPPPTRRRRCHRPPQGRSPCPAQEEARKSGPANECLWIPERHPAVLTRCCGGQGGRRARDHASGICGISLGCDRSIATTVIRSWSTALLSADHCNRQRVMLAWTVTKPKLAHLYTGDYTLFEALSTDTAETCIFQAVCRASVCNSTARDTAAEREAHSMERQVGSC